MSPRSTSAPAAIRDLAPSFERANPITECRALISSLTTAEPIKPVAPVTKIRILSSPYKFEFRWAQCCEFDCYLDAQHRAGSRARDYVTTGAGRLRLRTCPSDHPDRAARVALARGRPPQQSACLNSC